MHVALPPAAICIAAIMLCAPSTATASPEVRPQQGQLRVIASVITFNQGAPGATFTGWVPHTYVIVKVPGVRPGDPVGVRFIQGSTSTDVSYQLPVTRKSEALAAGYGSPARTLADARKQLGKLRGPALVEITPAGSELPLMATASKWTVLPATVLRDVKVTRSGKSVRFTGRLLTDSGAPVRGGNVRIAHFTEGQALGVGNSAAVDAQGRFTVTMPAPARSGSYGVAGFTSVKGWLLGASYSRAFTIKP